MGDDLCREKLCNYLRTLGDKLRALGNNMPIDVRNDRYCSSREYCYAEQQKVMATRIALMRQVS
jgi:hypothetical protein